MDHVLTGDEHIMFDGMPTGYLLSDFWAWSSSDLLNNTLRGHFAEFIVSASLGLNLKRPQADWAPYDVYYPMDKRSGIRIEVKSAAYLQAWEQQRPSSSASAQPGPGRPRTATAPMCYGSPMSMCSASTPARTVEPPTLLTSTTGTFMFYPPWSSMPGAGTSEQFRYLLWRNSGPKRSTLTGLSKQL